MTLRSRGLRLLGALALGVAVTPVLPAQAATTAAVRAPAASPPAQVTVVHGVRGLVADVRVDGTLVLSGFAPERVTDPLSLPAGTHRVQIWKAGAAATSTPVLDRMIPVTAGQHATLGVGLDSLGNPQITAFDDDLAEARGGATAIAVRDIAAAPAVRVTVDSTLLGADILAPQQKATQVRPGSHAVAVLPTGGASQLLPSQSVPAVAGRAMVLYLIGSAKDGSLGWITQTLRDADAPQSVETGVGPPVPAGPGGWSFSLAGLAVLAAAGLGSWIRRWRLAAAPAG